MTAQGNILFIVCQPCQEANEADFGIKVAGRTNIGWYAQEAPTKVLNAWFGKHRNCAGRGHPDHFVLAHMSERDHDQDRIKATVQDTINGTLNG